MEVIYFMKMTLQLNLAWVGKSQPTSATNEKLQRKITTVTLLNVNLPHFWPTLKGQGGFSKGQLIIRFFLNEESYRLILNMIKVKVVENLDHILSAF